MGPAGRGAIRQMIAKSLGGCGGFDQLVFIFDELSYARCITCRKMANPNLAEKIRTDRLAVPTISSIRCAVE